MSRSLIGTSNGLVSFTDLSNSVGLRLKNPRFYCFLNTAVNTVVSNEALMAKILNDDTFKVWGEGILFSHDPNFIIGVQRSTWDVLHSLNALKSNSIGCTEIHGKNCFHTVKQQISLKTLQFEILGEIKNLVKEQRGVRDATLLRKMLVKVSPSFKDDIQHDAGEAYLSLLQCIPDSDDLCSLRLRKIRTCIECNNVQVREDNEEWCLMLNSEEMAGKPLQVAVNEWCEATSRLEYECACKSQNRVNNSDNAEMYYTSHREVFEITKSPVFLHIKARDRATTGNTVKMLTKFFFNGVEYVLKSGMLYTGTGEGGHWRCIVLIGDRLTILDEKRTQ